LVTAEPVVQPLVASRQREYGLDWLRVIAFLILIGFHSGELLVWVDWSVKTLDISPSFPWNCLTGSMIFFHSWRLPLLFFIAGAGVSFSLRRRTNGQFVGERLRRLGIPFAFGIFVICPPQTYINRVRAGWHFASYWEFWGTIFNFVRYPAGNLHWWHLWFLPYILTYSLLGLPLYALLRAPAGRAFSDGLARLCDRPGMIYLLSIPNIFVAAVLGPYWPVTNNLTSDWANFTGSLVTFLWGFVICGSPRFLDLIQRRRREFLFVALAMTVLFFAIRLPHSLDGANPNQRIWIVALVDGNLNLAMIFTLVGWSRTLLNRDSPALRYANTAVYPFYVLHGTVLALLGYAWLGWHARLAVEFPALFAGTLVGCWLIYEAVRRNRVSRLLFGMKP
jgi:peptidoglycan/LPS O-acetylase OafA/YrhL